MSAERDAVDLAVRAQLVNVAVLPEDWETQLGDVIEDATEHGCTWVDVWRGATDLLKSWGAR